MRKRITTTTEMVTNDIDFRVRVAEESTSEETTDEKKADAAHPLVDYQHLPTWYQDSIYILSSYRPVSNSSKESFRSWLYLHNETVNIYSHLIPALAILIAIFGVDCLFTYRYPTATASDRALFLLYLVSIVVCFGLSATYHTLLNHSGRFSKLFLNIDYCGIMTLIFSHFITGEYVGFYCEPKLRNIYWSLISVFTATTAIFVLHPRFQSPRSRILRLAAFTALGLSAFAPIIHGLVLFKPAEFARRSGLYYYLGEGGLVLVAAILFGTRFPESRWPGKFDVWGASHQIFHVLTVATAAVHFLGLWSAYDIHYHDRRC